MISCSNSREFNEDYLKISTISDYWIWMEKKRFLDDLPAQQWYNRIQVRNLSGYLNDESHGCSVSKDSIVLHRFVSKRQNIHINQDGSINCTFEYR
jgi:hypothetical protein